MDQREIFSNYKYTTKVPQVKAPNDGKCYLTYYSDPLFVRF